MHDDRTKHEFRALREIVGLDRDELAKLTGATLANVAAWENPQRREFPPDAAWEIVYELVARQQSAVDETYMLVSDVEKESGKLPRLVAVPYWLSAADYERMHLERDDDTWKEANATSRAVARMLWELDVGVRFYDGSRGIDAPNDENERPDLRLV